jgi:hypothetical protein
MVQHIAKGFKKTASGRILRRGHSKPTHAQDEAVRIEWEDKVIRLCQIITGSSPDTPIKGIIESLAFEIETQIKLMRNPKT